MKCQILRGAVIIPVEALRMPRIPFENFQAAKNCLAANPTTSSGAMTAMSINFSRRQIDRRATTSFHLSRGQNASGRVGLGGGTFGWADTQVHAKIVVRQPQTMSNSLRQLLMSSHDSELLGARRSRPSPCAGLALRESRWTM